MTRSNPPDPRIAEIRALSEAAKASTPNAPYTGLSWQRVLDALDNGSCPFLGCDLPNGHGHIWPPSVVPDQPRSDATWDVTSTGQNETQTVLCVTSVPDPTPERTKPCTRCKGTGREADSCCGHVTVLGESCPDGCCIHGGAVTTDPETTEER